MLSSWQEGNCVICRRQDDRLLLLRPQLLRYSDKVPLGFVTSRSLAFLTTVLISAKEFSCPDVPRANLTRIQWYYHILVRSKVSENPTPVLIECLVSVPVSPTDKGTIQTALPRFLP